MAFRDSFQSPMTLRRCLCFLASLQAFSVVALAADKPQPVPSGPQSDGPFRKVILAADRDVDGDGKVDDVLVDPMEIAVAPDGRVLIVERAGVVKVLRPGERDPVVAGRIEVFHELEDGLLGIALDPAFASNGWVYLFHSDPATRVVEGVGKMGDNIVSRFTLQGDVLDMASRKELLRIPTQREQCCHSAGSLAFDAQGNLYVATGDNTHPGESDGYSPSDERDGRGPWNALKSAANANDLRGKILRIHPEPDGTATVPQGNLFAPGTPKTRPEIYVMGNRNPWRISVDRVTGFLYWGEVGPDAGGPSENRGPAGFDEVNQARAAGNFGWPMFIGDNRPYRRHDFASRTNGPAWDPEHPANESRHNTGPRDLPPAQGAFVWYPYGASTRFPAVGSGGRTACAGPVYRFDPASASPRRLPRELDHVLFVHEWSRNWIMAVHLDAEERIARRADGTPWMEKFCPGMTFLRPTDMEVGPDGCLYVLENGTAWTGNRDTQLVRIEHVP